ncbi:MAG TPA: DUF4931 domain-containing protein [Anaeromyxobacter sp.]|nr:DUF4931 domain-containing protein [Anaeromyxobacter sp.]
MPELRRDPIVGRRVVIATERAQRPSELPHVPPAARPDGVCPFCPGHEDQTPREVYAIGRAHGAPANGPGWKVRGVPNRFPALKIEGDLDRQAEGIYDRMNGIGAHEVVIETADHARTLEAQSAAEITEVLLAFKARILDLRNDARFRYILLFKNHGASAGASLEHAHSQLIALPIVPRQVVSELEGARRHYELKERCIYCDIVGQERKDALGNPPYNFMVHSNPLRDAASPSSHWHIEIMPALTHVAGFEWGSGAHTNPVPPEEAAELLRKASG